MVDVPEHVCTCKYPWLDPYGVQCMTREEYEAARPRLIREMYESQVPRDYLLDVLPHRASRAPAAP